jgi:hypothetical protein
MNWRVFGMGMDREYNFVSYMRNCMEVYENKAARLRTFDVTSYIFKVDATRSNGNNSLVRTVTITIGVWVKKPTVHDDRLYSVCSKILVISLFAQFLFSLLYIISFFLISLFSSCFPF